MYRSGLSDSCTQPSHRSVANHLTLPNVRFSTLPLSSLGLPRSLGGLGFAISPAGSPSRPAESRSLSYGPMVHLRLLSTPPRGDAVTFRYRPESAGLEGTRTPLIEYTLRRTGADALVGTVLLFHDERHRVYRNGHLPVWLRCFSDHEVLPRISSSCPYPRRGEDGPPPPPSEATHSL